MVIKTLGRFQKKESLLNRNMDDLVFSYEMELKETKY